MAVENGNGNGKPSRQVDIRLILQIVAMLGSVFLATIVVTRHIDQLDARIGVINERVCTLTLKELNYNPCNWDARQ